MKLYLAILTLTACVFIPLTGFQPGLIPEYKVEHVSLEEGISNNMIFSIYQDSKGFLWYGTMFGLVRYDGVNYKTFRHNPSDSNSISNDDVVSICEDNDGCLWIGTYFGGLNRYDSKTGTFKRFLYSPDNSNTISSSTVWKIIQDKNGSMWFGTEGGGLCKYENGSFTAYKRDSLNPASIGGNSIYSLMEDKDGNIWAGTGGGGLSVFNKQTGSFTRYRPEPYDSSSLSGNVVRSLYEDKEGIIWAGTINKGLNRFDKSSKTFIRYQNNSEDGDTSSQKNSVFSIMDDAGRQNCLQISTGSGFYSFDKTNNTFNRIRIYDSLSQKPENIVTSLTDNSGVIWLSTYFDGLHKVYKNNDKFITYHASPERNGKSLSNPKVNCFFEDKSGSIWIGTQNGLNKLNAYGDFTYYFTKPGDNNSLSDNSINSIAGDNDGNLWIGTDNGLNKINPAGKIERFYNDPQDSASLTSNGITKIITSRDNTIWVGTVFGLNKYAEKEKKFERYISDRADTASLSDNMVLSLFEDKNRNLWVGTYSGINRLNGDLKSFTHYKKIINDTTSLSNNYIFSFCQDSRNNLWIGTGGGLNKFDAATGSFTSYLEKNGLPNSVICGIEEDTTGNLWLSTKKGLSKFNPVEKIFTNYSASDGLQSNMFTEGAYYKLTDGKILFGGISGFNIIDPLRVKESNFEAPLLLTTLTKLYGNEKMEIDISGEKEIELAYNDNVLAIEFASLDYTNPQKNKYAYMLEGFEDSWNYTDGSPKAEFTNLDPGTYTFRVKGTNSDGVWNNAGASIIINIKPPFWKTWWFYFLIITAIILLGMAIQNYRVRMRVKNLLEIEKAKEKEREILREQASRDYHDELGHKLTRISIHSKRIKKKLGSSANGITSDLIGIVDTSQSLQSGAKDLIWSLNPQEDSLHDFAVRLKDFGNEIFDNTGIEFKMTGIDDDFKNIKLSMHNKRHLIFIFKEAMNNALKYSDCKNISINISLKNNILEITLADDGIGFIPSNDLKGYGLKNIYNRTKKVNGNVEIDSMLNKGTTITFNVQI